MSSLLKTSGSSLRSREAPTVNPDWMQPDAMQYHSIINTVQRPDRVVTVKSWPLWKKTWSLEAPSDSRSI